MLKQLTIEQLRKQIEAADALIIQTLAKRQALAKQIGQLKLNSGTEIIDPLREAELFAWYESLAAKYQLPPLFIKELFTLIISQSKTIQKLT